MGYIGKEALGICDGSVTRGGAGASRKHSSFLGGGSSEESLTPSPAALHSHEVTAAGDDATELAYDAVSVC